MAFFETLMIKRTISVEMIINLLQQRDDHLNTYRPFIIKVRMILISKKTFIESFEKSSLCKSNDAETITQ